MANNQPAPSTYTEPYGVLIGNDVSTPGGSSDSVPLATQVTVGGVTSNVSAILELQSTTHAFLLPRMTTTQRNAIAYPANGMMVYNTTTNSVNTYEGGVWGASGGGDVDGPGSATNTALPYFDGTTGKLLGAASVLLSPITGVISAIGGLVNAVGTAAAPTITFTGDTDTGIFRAGANQIGFATAGVLQATITGGATSVNTIEIVGAPTGSAPSIIASGSDPNIPLTLEAQAAAIQFITDTEEQASIEHTANAVNRITLTGSTAGAAAIIATAGTSATIPLSIAPKNNGATYLNDGAAATPGIAFNGATLSNTTGLFHNSNVTARLHYIGTSLNGAAKTALNENGVLSIGGTTFDTTLTNGIQISAGTAPTGVASVLEIYGATIAGNVGTLGLRIPAGSLTASVDNVVTNKIQVQVNGTTYYLLATTSAA